MHAWLEDVVKANIRSEPKHKGSLCHIGADHSAGTDNEQLFVSKVFHNNIDIIVLPQKWDKYTKNHYLCADIKYLWLYI